MSDPLTEDLRNLNRLAKVRCFHCTKWTYYPNRSVWGIGILRETFLGPLSVQIMK